MITAVVLTDGRRECITRSVASLEHLRGPVSVRMIHDDSGDPAYAAWLWDRFPGWVVHSTPERSGFAGAVRSARQWLARYDRNPYVWWHEDDFVITRTVDLPAMCDVLSDDINLVQLALRRQPWNDSERAAGGIVEQHPDAYYEIRDSGRAWLEHRRFYTTNPHLTRRGVLTDTDWPTGAESEGRYGLALFANPRLRAGFWGARDSGEWCEHIGHTRAGTGY